MDVRARMVTVLVAIVTASLLTTARPAQAVTTVESQVVRFTVLNINRSHLSCAADGQTYTVTGHLVRPSGRRAAAVTLYLHGLAFGEKFWDFEAVPGYDYSRGLALAGETSVVIDRLGYGDSQHPDGNRTCLGAQADMAHQIVDDLRRGTYTVEGSSPTAFRRVGVVGHSAGGLIAQVEGYSFHDVDFLGVMGFADVGPSLRATAALEQAVATCGHGATYAPYGGTDAGFAGLMFHSASPPVVAAATAARDRDPCGDLGSLFTGIVVDLVGVPTIRVPTILLYGSDDALFPPPSGLVQRALYIGDRDVTVATLPATGHALTLEASHLVVETLMIAWLRVHGI